MCPCLCQRTSVGNWHTMVCVGMGEVVEKPMAGVEGCEHKFERHLSILSKVCSQQSPGVSFSAGIPSQLSGPLIPRVGVGVGVGCGEGKAGV